MELLPQLLEQPVKKSYLHMDVVSDYGRLGDHSRVFIFTDNSIEISQRWRSGRTKKQGKMIDKLEDF